MDSRKKYIDMNLIVGQRIRIARKLAGLTLRKLAAGMGNRVSYNALFKYENGLMLPNGEVLNSLVKVLDVTKESLFARPTFTADQIVFLNKRKLNPEAAIFLKEKLHERISRFVEIEQLLGIEFSFIHPSDDYVIRNITDAEDSAERIRQNWGIGVGPIPSVVNLIEKQGVRIIPENIPFDIDGLAGWNSDHIPFIIISNKFFFFPETMRMIILRELGRLILKFEEGLRGEMTSQLCNRFSAAFLLPRETFIGELGKKRNLISTPELVRMKETYGIPVKTIMERAKALGVISDDTYRNFRMRMSVNPDENSLGWFCGRERFDRYKILVFKAAAEGVISPIKAASLLNLTRTEFRMRSLILCEG